MLRAAQVRRYRRRVLPTAAKRQVERLPPCRRPLALVAARIFAASLQAPEPQPVLARAHSKAHNVVGVLVCVLLAIALEVFGYNFQFFYSMTYPDAGSYLVNGAQPSQVGTITLDSSSSLV